MGTKDLFKKVVSIIPIKLNNERLPGKNTRKLGDKPLIYYVQSVLLEVPQICERYVYCSSDEIASFLLNGVSFLKRPENLDLPSSNFTQIFESFMGEVDADMYVYAHATAPFVTSQTVIDCINAVYSGGYDSAFCAQKIQDFLWQNGEPLNFDANNLPRSQDLSLVFRETSGVYVFTKEVFEKYHRRIGIKPFIKTVTFRESIDINTSDDFRLAEIFVNLPESI
jgi:CMP-N-acetylneuraminic acid synthetase